MLYSFIGMPAAQRSARLAGAATGFFGHKRFTFQHRNWQLTRTAWQRALFGLLWITNYLVSTWGIITVVNTIDIYAPMTKIMVEIILAPVRYVMIRRVIFPPLPITADSD